MRLARTPLALVSLALLVGAVACVGGEPGADEVSPDAGVPTDAPGPDSDPAPEAPETVITLGPPALTNQPVRVEFISTIAGSSFTCAIDGAAPIPCASPFAPALTDGAHELRVSATAPLGAIDRSPAIVAWTLDTVAPTTALVTAPPPLDNSAAASFQFASEPAATFACAVDGGPFTVCDSPYHTPPLTDGDHTFEVRAADLAGNVDSSPRRHSWTLDLGTPDTVIERGPEPATTATDATFDFSSPDAGAGAAFVCARDGLAPVACVSPWATADLTEGEHTVRIAVRDAAGNVDPSPAVLTWRVDNTPPTVEISGGPAGFAGDATPTFTFVRGGDPVSTECRITGSGATPFAPCQSPFTAATIPDGDATFEVRVRDQVGLAASATRAFTVDTVAPAITITSAPSGVITASEIEVAFTVSEALATACALDGAEWAPCDGAFQVAVLVDGAHTVRVRAVDAAGNEALASRTFRRDTEAPIVTIIFGPSGPTGDPAPRFEFRVADAGSSTQRSCQIDDQTVVSCPLGYFDAPRLLDGAHVFTITAVDAVGHVGSASRTFSVDTRSISVRITAYPPARSSNTRPTMGYVTTGAILERHCKVDDGPWGDCPGTDGSWTVATPLTDGSHTLTIGVYGLGHFSSTTGPQFIIDTTVP